MTPVKNLFMDTFGVEGQVNWGGNFGGSKSRSRAPSSILIHENAMGSRTSTATLPIQNSRPTQANGGESLALKTLFSGGQAIDRTNGTIISYYIKKK